MASGPTGPLADAIFIEIDLDAIESHGFLAVKALRQVPWIGQVCRGLTMGRRRNQAHAIGDHVTNDANATQHQGFEFDRGHCKPPAFREG
jgi:hypothetical protein